MLRICEKHSRCVVIYDNQFCPVCGVRYLMRDNPGIGKTYIGKMRDTITNEQLIDLLETEQLIDLLKTLLKDSPQLRQEIERDFVSVI